MELPRTPIVEPLYLELDMAHVRKSVDWGPIVRAFAERVSLDEIVNSVLRDRSLLNAVAASSYRHPNGFDKIILFRDSIDALIKIDIWWPEDTGWGRIHNHRFDFGSIVLFGRLRQRNYLPTRSDEGAVNVYRLSVPSSPDDAVPNRRAFLKAWEGEIPAGGCYEIDCNQFHQACGSGDDPAVTLVAQGAARRPYSEVVGDLEPEAPRVAFTPSEVADRLDRLGALAPVPVG